MRQGRAIPNEKSRFVYQVRDGKQFVLEYYEGDLLVHGPMDSAADAKKLIAIRKLDKPRLLNRKPGA